MIPTVGVLVHKLIFCRYVFFVNTKTAKYCVGKQIYVHVHVGLTRFYCLCLLLTEPRPSAVRQRDVRRRSVLHKPRAQRIQRQVSQLTHIVVDVLGVAFSLENAIIMFIVTVSANDLYMATGFLHRKFVDNFCLHRNWFVVLEIIVTCCLFTHTETRRTLIGWRCGSRRWTSYKRTSSSITPPACRGTHEYVLPASYFRKIAIKIYCNVYILFCWLMRRIYTLSDVCTVLFLTPSILWLDMPCRSFSLTVYSMCVRVCMTHAYAWRTCTCCYATAVMFLRTKSRDVDVTLTRTRRRSNKSRVRTLW